MTTAPLLAIFAVRLSFGLATAVFFTPWRSVPLPFFRTLSQVMLGLIVLAALDQGRSAGEHWAVGLLVAGGVVAYVATLAWGLGLPKIAVGAAVLEAVITAAWLVAAVRTSDASDRMRALELASGLASGFLMGSTLTAMLLGHYYLTAPSMSIEPLKKLVALMGWGLGARCLCAGIAVWASRGALADLATASPWSISGSLLAARWGLGFVASGIATYLTWKTAEIRSTQSATGILYISVIFVLFGELTSMVLAGRGGIVT
jgi:hypothetical protein